MWCWIFIEGGEARVIITAALIKSFYNQPKYWREKEKTSYLICFLCFPFQFETEDWDKSRNWQKFPQLPVHHHHQEENNLRVCFRILIKVWLVQSSVFRARERGVTCSDGEGVGGVPSNYRGWMIQLWSKKITSHHPSLLAATSGGSWY